MVFALLIAAILWNLGTWWLGLPASSSHTHGGFHHWRGACQPVFESAYRRIGTGLGQVIKVLKALLISPLIGFLMAGF